MSTQTATITCKYVNPVKPGGKKGSIKTADGQLYLVWPDKLATFSPNVTYDVEYQSDTGQDGREWRTIKSAIPTGQNPAPAQRSYQGGNARPQQNYRPTAPADAERMFVCSILNASVQGGQITFEGDALFNAVNVLRGVWQDTFGRDGAAEH